MAGSYIAAGRTDHVGQAPSDRLIVEMASRADGSVEWCTVEYAVNRLSGYYNDDPEGWIERTLRSGAPLQTTSFIYRIPGVSS